MTLTGGHGGDPDRRTLRIRNSILQQGNRGTGHPGAPVPASDQARMIAQRQLDGSALLPQLPTVSPLSVGTAGAPQAGQGGQGVARTPLPATRTHVPLGPAAALSHQLPNHRSKARRAGTNQSPGAERKGKRPAGAREAEFNPQPGRPETAARARGEQRGFCAGPARERGGGGRRARPPRRTERPLFPRTKGTVAHGGGR